MNQEPKELTARLAFLQEANEQLKVFHESGRHIPGQIMDVWMDRLSTDSPRGTDQEQAKPPLHT